MTYYPLGCQMYQ